VYIYIYIYIYIYGGFCFVGGHNIKGLAGRGADKDIQTGWRPLWPAFGQAMSCMGLRMSGPGRLQDMHGDSRMFYHNCCEPGLDALWSESDHLPF